MPSHSDPKPDLNGPRLGDLEPELASLMQTLSHVPEATGVLVLPGTDLSVIALRPKPADLAAETT